MNYTDLCRINMYGMYTTWHVYYMACILHGMYSIIAKHIKDKEKLQKQGVVVFDLDDF